MHSPSGETLKTVSLLAVAPVILLENMHMSSKPHISSQNPLVSLLSLHTVHTSMLSYLFIGAFSQLPPYPSNPYSNDLGESILDDEVPAFPPPEPPDPIICQT